MSICILLCLTFSKLLPLIFCFRVHYRDKGTVGQRLSLAGLAVAYGQSGILYQGPWPSTIMVDTKNFLIKIAYSSGKVPITVRNTEGFEVRIQCSALHLKLHEVKIILSLIYFLAVLQEHHSDVWYEWHRMGLRPADEPWFNLCCLECKGMCWEVPTRNALLVAYHPLPL